MLQRVPRRANGGDRLVGRAALEDDEHGRTELVREVRIQPVVQRRGGAREVRPLAEDEVEAGLQRLVLRHDALPQVVVGRDRAGFLLRERAHLLGRGVDLVAAADEVDLRVGPVT